MRHSVLIITFSAALIVLSAPSLAHADVNVVASLPTLGALAKAVGGEHVTVTTLAAPNEDPHYVDPRPNFVLSLNKADLLIANGMELEVGWLPKLQDSARNADINVGGTGYIDASEYVQRLEVPNRKIERSEGDVHPQGNPHYLADPASAALVAQGIAERLVELDPANEDDYMANADKVVAELERFAREQRERFAALDAEKRQVVVYHASMVYLCTWLQLEQVTTVEPRPGITPDPGHVASVLKTMKAKAIKAIIQEAYYPTGTSKKLSEITGAQVVVFQGGVDFEGGATYLEFAGRNVDALYDALN